MLIPEELLAYAQAYFACDAGWQGTSSTPVRPALEELAGYAGRLRDGARVTWLDRPELLAATPWVSAKGGGRLVRIEGTDGRLSRAIEVGLDRATAPSRLVSVSVEVDPGDPDVLDPVEREIALPGDEICVLLGFRRGGRLHDMFASAPLGPGSTWLAALWPEGRPGPADESGPQATARDAIGALVPELPLSAELATLGRGPVLGLPE